MEDSNSDDDNMRDGNLSPKMGGKKLKLNDGSSQESLKDVKDDTASSSKTATAEENADSGVSVDKSESTSSEDRAASASGGPSNEVVNVAPSCSNIRTILLNIRRTSRMVRNYRKRGSSDHDSDSNSSRDSDDLSVEEGATSGSRQTENSDDDNQREELQRFIANQTDESDGSEFHMGDTDNSSDESNNSDLVRRSSESDQNTDTDDGLWTRGDDDDENIETEDKGKTPNVLLKTRPKHNYLLLREIMNREMGLTFPSSQANKNAMMFEQKFYGSLHVVYRMKKLHHLNKHRGCVNSINFHPEGNLLASGSDDMNVVVWDWARNSALQTIKTGHKSNVFQSKFLYLNARSQLNIVTCARDGQVRLLQCPPSGGSTVSRRRLASHSRAAHKLHVMRSEPHIVISAGEDGMVMQSDVRTDHATRLFQVKENKSNIPLYSVHGHPIESRLLVLAGRDRFLRVYDRRNCSKPTALYCPNVFRDNVNAQKKKLTISMRHLTCAVYNHDGSEILGSYNEEDIYLFDTKADVFDKDSPKEGYTHRYSGHRNSATFKGVAFFGPKSQYIVSGSDCSYIYIWDKETESIVQWMQGDNGGVVNCIETHPRTPVLATSGLDKDVKIWLPSNDADPTYSGMERVVRENTVLQLRSPLFNDFLPSIYSAWRGESQLLHNEDFDLDRIVPRFGGNVEFDGNVCTAF